MTQRFGDNVKRALSGTLDETVSLNKDYISFGFLIYRKTYSLFCNWNMFGMAVVNLKGIALMKM